MKRILFVIIAFIALTGFSSKEVPGPCNQWVAMEYDFFPPPSIISYAPRNLTITADEGQVAVMEITFGPRIDPSLEVEYLFNGRPLYSLPSRFITFCSDGFIMFEIRKLSKHDSGVYSIRIRNKSGEASVNFTLTVKE